MTRVAIGRDVESASLLNFANSYAGTSTTAPAATTYTTDGVNIPVNSVVGQAIVTTTVFGIIVSNTAAASSVLTIDRWYSTTALPANVNAAAAATPAVGAWQIPAGNVPAAYIGLTATATAAVDGDTVLTGELNAAGAAGLNRQLATYAHTAAATTTTLTKTFTTAAADTIPVTIAQMAVFQGVVLASSRMVFRTVLSATATMSAVGDQLALTHTTTL